MVQEQMKSEKIKMAMVAYASSIGMEQKQIAEYLKISQPHVSRLLKDAATLGLLKKSSIVLDLPKEIEDQMYSNFPDTKLGDQIIQKYGTQKINEIRVIPSCYDAQAFNREKTTERVNWAAALYIKNLLEKKLASSLFSFGDFKEPAKLIGKLRDAKRDSDSVSSYLKQKLSENFQQKIDIYKDGVGLSKEFIESLIAEFNSLLEIHLFQQEIFECIKLSEEAKRLLSSNDIKAEKLQRLNRLLLEDIYPYEIAKSKIIVGCKWGKMLWDVSLKLQKLLIDEVAVYGEEYREKIRNLYFVPLFGNLLFEYSEDHVTYNASLIAEQLNKCVNALKPSISFLTPAYINWDYIPLNQPKKDEEILIIRNFLEQTPGYSMIYGGKDRNAGLINELDLIIVGVGDAKHTSWHKARLLSPEEYSEFENKVVGDIGGIFFPVDDNNKDFAENLNSRILGPKIENLKRLKEHGRTVLTVATEPQKAKVIKCGIESGCLSCLVISRDLAKEIINLPSQS